MSTPLSRHLLLSALSALPQATHVPETVADAWADAALAHDPTGAAQRAERLAGFDAFDMGVLVCAAQGLFHPSSDARTVTRAKLLLDPPGPPSAQSQRRQALTKIARERYRAQVVARGGRPRDDLLKKAQAQAGGLPGGPCWLLGDLGDIVEENDRLFVVDYQTPSAIAFQELRNGHLPYHQEVQLHHARLLAAAAGVPTDGLRQFAFGADEWDGVETSVPINATLETHILAVGERAWNGYVLAGVPAPEVSVNRPQSLDDLALVVDGNPVSVPVADTAQRTTDGQPVYVGAYALSHETLPRLREQLQQLGTEIFGHTVLKGETEKMREVLLRNIRDALPIQTLPPDVSRIDLGAVRLKADWHYHAEKVLEAVRGSLAMAGQSDEEIATMLDSENFFQPATFALEPLLAVLKEKKGIDLDADPDFLTARVAPRRRRTDTLVTLLKDLERNLEGGVDWTQLIDYGQSQLNVEVVRAPMAGFGRELRDRTAQELRAAAVPAVRRVGADHVRQLREEQTRQAAAEASRPPTRRRKM